MDFPVTIAILTDPAGDNTSYDYWDRVTAQAEKGFRQSRFQRLFWDATGLPAEAFPMALRSLRRSFRKFSGLELSVRGSIPLSLFDKAGFVLQKSESLHCFKFDEKKYQANLAARKLPSNASNIVFTTEYAGLCASGGIGTYVRELKEILGKDAPLVCIVAEPFPNTAAHTGTIFIRELLTDRPEVSAFLSSAERLNLLVLLAVQELLFWYDEISTIECQDFWGLGASLIQAKKCGILPSRIHLVTVMHGSMLYLKNAGALRGDPDPRLLSLERTSVEQVDEIHFLTDFLRELYGNLGLRLPPKRITLLPGPVYLDKPPRMKYEAIDRIVFLGRFDDMKGWCDLVSLLRHVGPLLAKEKPVRRITLSLLARDIVDVATLKELSQWFNIERHAFERDAVVDWLREKAPRALVIIPYRADNHPYAVVEVIRSGCHPLVYERGGAPELIPKSLRKIFTTAATLEAASKEVLHLLSLAPSSRAKSLRKLHATFWNERKKVNAVYLKRSHRKMENTPKEEPARNVEAMLAARKTIRESLRAAPPERTTAKRKVKNLIKRLGKSLRNAS